MKTVAESTVELDRKLMAGEPLTSNEVAYIFALDDDAQRYRNAPGHARSVRTDRIEAAVEQCYRDHQAHLEVLPLRQRTRELAAKMARALARPGCRSDLTDVPDIRIGRRVGYRLAGP